MSASHAHLSPARLRPGVHVVRRDGASVQVGLDAPHRVILPADEHHTRLLGLLRDGPSPDLSDPMHGRVVDELRGAGLLEEPGEAAPAAVVLHDHGLGAGVDRLAALLGAVGIDVRSADDATRGAPPALLVGCSAAPLPREVVDEWVAEGAAHLVVSGTGRPGALRLGPLVEPGLSACLRCVDAAQARHDPRRPLIVEQLARRPAAPVDPLVLELSTAWVARDVRAFLQGRPASTWSATVEVDPDTAPVPPPTRWARHPDCGCCWDELPY